MSDVVNIESCFEKFHDLFSPKIVGELNGQLVMLVRCEGDMIPWHTHEAEDEMFLVLEGSLEILQRDRRVTLNAGELYIVPRGTEHRIVPGGHVKLMLFEPATISHTGNVTAEVTRSRFDRL
jgi:mannose-6-phosphate isomerase-like protein (cupin superfamily)